MQHFPYNIFIQSFHKNYFRKKYVVSITFFFILLSNIYLGAEFVWAEFAWSEIWWPSWLWAEFAMGRVCHWPSLLWAEMSWNRNQGKTKTMMEFATFSSKNKVTGFHNM